MQTRQHSVSDRVIRWAFLFEEIKPLNTNSCSLFWRCAVVSPLKIALPVCVAGFFAAVLLWRPVVYPVVEAFFPGSLEPLRPLKTVPPEHVRLLVYLVAGAVALGAAAYIAEKAGFFDWLNRFCYPVEIEGGFVRKGSCPNCASRMVLIEADRWSCRKCHGYFVPLAPPAAS